MITTADFMRDPTTISNPFAPKLHNAKANKSRMAIKNGTGYTQRKLYLSGATPKVLT